MRTIKAQKGAAVIIMAILMGISVIAVTVTVANSYMTKKESNVTGHAQVNSQMLAWAGVSTFREYLVEKGGNNFDEVKVLPSSINLKDAQGKKVSVNNIQVTGCDSVDDECLVEADVSAENASSKAALTINTVFDVKLLSRGGAIPKVGGSGTFGGGLILDGTIGAEEPNSKITLNVDGDLTVNTGARFQNIAELNVNVCNGDVKIFCSLVSSSSFCKIPKININSCGNIFINDTAKYGDFGELYAKGNITLMGAQADNLHAVGDVDLSVGSNVSNGIEAGGNVHAWAGAGIVNALDINTGDIKAGGNVTLVSKGASAKNIAANGNVELWLGASSNNVSAGGKVDVHTGGNAWDIDANGRIYVGEILVGVAIGRAKTVRSNTHVEIHTGGKVDNIYTTGYAYIGGLGSEVFGEIIARGDRTTTQSSTIYNILGGTVRGNLYARGDMRLTDYAAIKGNGYASDYIRDGIGTDLAFWYSRFHKNNSTQVNQAIDRLNAMPAISATPVDAAALKQNIKDVVDAATAGIKSYVSVYPYKEEANYIFTKSYGTKRVYLNKLTHPAKGEYYFYDVVNNKQYVEKEDGSSELLNGTGEAFYLGKYTLGGNTFIGAVCAEGDSDGYCTSKIIGYLPRIGLKENPSVDGGLFTGIGVGIINLFTGSKNADYEYINNNKYVVSSVSKRSNIDNAVLAPGIMYFDDDLVIRGRGISAASGSDYSAFINTFLAEGDIDVALFSPNIYSPYNATRETTESAVCDRVLKNMDNMVQGTPATVPETESNKYLRATNLCKAGNKFANNMNIDSATNTIVSVNIDGKTVPKLDLGYVGLMSNKSIHLQFCSQIYGDVLAKGAIHSSTELICGGGQRQKVTGSMTSETGNTGAGGLLGALANTNKIMLGASYIVAKQEYSNFDGGQDPTAPPAETLGADEVIVKWFRLK